MSAGATNWAARLDARGYHVETVTRPNPQARWDCEPAPMEREDGTWLEGDAITVYDAADEERKLRVAVGDAVYLRGRAKGKPAEIARIDNIFLGKDNSIYFYNTFFWRPEQLNLRDDEPWELKELFLYAKAEENPNSVAAIELTPVRVTECSTEFTDAPHTFFQRRTVLFTKEGRILSPMPAAAAAKAQPMETDAAPEAAPEAAPAPAPAKAPRRNANAERDARVAELEAQVAELQSKLEQMDSLACAVRALDAKFDAMSATE